jgi:hypothetical protein
VLSQLKDRWLDHPRVDLVVAMVTAAGHAVVAVETRHGDLLLWAGNGRRAAVYTATAGVAALVAAFGTLANNLYRSSAGGPRLSRINEEDRRTLRRSLRAALLLPLLVAGVSIICLALDTTNRDAGGVRFVFEFAFLLGALTILRVGALFSALDDINDRDESEPEVLPAPDVALSDLGPRVTRPAKSTRTTEPSRSKRSAATRA